MLDLGWAELLLVAVVALIVVGPKDLPAALRTVSGYVRQARAMAREFQRGLDDIAKDSGIHDIKRDLQESAGLGLEDDIKDALTVNFDDDDDEPKKISGNAADKAVDPTGSENSIMDPEQAKKIAAKPVSAPADDAGPEETPKPDIVSAEAPVTAKKATEKKATDKKAAEKATQPAKASAPTQDDASAPAPEEASNRA